MKTLSGLIFFVIFFSVLILAYSFGLHSIALVWLLVGSLPSAMIAIEIKLHLQRRGLI